MIRNHLKNNIRPLFIVASIIFGGTFYSLSESLTSPDSRALQKPPIYLYLLLHAAAVVIVYFLSFKEDVAEGKFARSRECLIIFAFASGISMIFPALSFFGLYPVSMAGVHLAIIFCTAISFAAITLGFLLSILVFGDERKNSPVYLAIVTVMLLFGIVYICPILLGLMTR